MSASDDTYHVRSAGRGDIPALVVCATASTTEEETVGFGRPRAERVFADSEKLSAEWVEPNHVGREEVFVAEKDGTVVGYVTVEDRDDSLELNNIDVPRDHHGRGVGSCLVRFVEERARRKGKPAVTLGTSRNAEGKPWRSFDWWQRRGYRVTGEVENAWTRSIGPGVQEIRMRKELLEE